MVCAARPENRQARADPQSISDSRTSARVGSTAALAAVVQAYWVPVPHARLARRGALEFRRHLRRFWRLVLQGKGEVCPNTRALHRPSRARRTAFGDALAALSGGFRWLKQ